MGIRRFHRTGSVVIDPVPVSIFDTSRRVQRDIGLEYPGLLCHSQAVLEPLSLCDTSSLCLHER